MTPTPPPVSPPPKQTSPATRGCLIALAVVGGLGLICVLGSAIVAWRAASSDEGKKILDAMGKGVSLVSKGASAPGVAEVRGVGCPEAMALDVHEMMQLIGEFVDGGVKGDMPVGMMVMCQGMGELPDCDTVAQAYVSNPQHAPGEFVVMVKTKHTKKQLCSRRYSEDGEDLGEFSEKK